MNNDSSSETFILRHTLGGLPFPCRYLKIVPLQSWGCTYNFSIWFIELKGSDNFNEVKKAVEWFDTVSDYILNVFIRPAHISNNAIFLIDYSIEKKTL